MSTLRERFRYLPFPLPHLLEAESEAFMLRVAARLGGAVIRVNQTDGGPTPTMIRLLGQDDTDRLARILATFGVLKISMPTMRSTTSQVRAVRIVRARADGQTVMDIALRERIGERQVYNIMARARSDGITANTPLITLPWDPPLSASLHRRGAALERLQTLKRVESP